MLAHSVLTLLTTTTAPTIDDCDAPTIYTPDDASHYTPTGRIGITGMLYPSFSSYNLIYNQ